ncbi:hypothetical protein C8R48DRAFT_23320 [Suillus tomentosus]|nr:hypothetical protein C8R48DRAFT_23320 [Suillus tomentosus]
MFSFIPPGAGMYLWMKFHLNQLDPSFASGDEDTLDTKLWIKLPENGVLFRPGWMFTRTANAMIKNSHSTDSGHFCVCFINIDVRVLISMHLRATWFPDLEKISHYLRVRMTHPRVLSTEGLVLDTGQLFGVSNDHHVDRNVTVYQETLT